VKNEIQHGYLVLADITGYTSYLVGTELEHAQDVLAELLELIVQQFQPTLEIGKLEGDAVFAHIPKSKIPRGELLLQVEEATYVAFRDRVEGIRRRTTCQCNACRSIPSLDLKFITHFGAYMLQQVSGITELVGSDVNLVHRLLKNQVGEATGWSAYLLFTGAALDQLNVKLENLRAFVERYEYLGDVKTYALDLHARYKDMIEARRVVVTREEAHAILTRTIPAPPVVLWEWMNDPQKRLQWEAFDDVRPLVPGTRTGTGTRNHCAHGKNIVLETIVDWRPFEYYTLDYPMGIRSQFLEPVPGGTRLSVYFKLKMPLPRWLARLIAAGMNRRFKIEAQFDRLVRLIEEAETEE
jgi:hypothetical protein